MWGSIISAGATLAGGLFGSKPKKQTSSINYVQMARNAEKAGFNPLTALRNGGSAGFTSTVSHPGLSGLGDAIAQVGGQIGAAVSQKLDPIEQKRSQVESSLLDYQLQQIQSGALGVPRLGDVPSAAGSANWCKGLRLWRSPGRQAAFVYRRGRCSDGVRNRFERSVRD